MRRAAPRLGRFAIDAERVLIVENKVNLLTLPPLAGAIALGGLGYGVVNLRYVTWLAERKIYYWGDIDIDGFEILSSLRKAFPQTESLLMDQATVERWRVPLGTEGNGRSGTPPAHLTTAESAVYLCCSRDNLRLEQERLPQAESNCVLTRIFSQRTLTRDAPQ